MKRIFIIGSLLVSLGLVWAFSTRYNFTKEAVLLQLVTMGLQQNHYQPLDFNDEFSAKVFDSFIESLDYNKRFFLASDIELLKQQRLLVDDQVRASEYTFFNLADSLYAVRLAESEKYFSAILALPFNYELKEVAEFDSEKLSWAKDSADLYDRWRKALKFECLRNVDQQESVEKSKTEGAVLSLDSLDAKARVKVLKNYSDWYKRMMQLNTEDRREVFLNTIAETYDPHTNYLAPKHKEDYDIGLSGQLEGIGATLQQADGYIKVVKIQPGSPSWKQGELQDGDLILKVAQGDDEPVDVVDMRLDDAVLLIRGKKGTTVKLTVKKRDNSIKVIAIVRDVVNIEETFAKSAILHDGDNTFGYIYLPKFYAKFDKADGRSCADDVEIELKDMKAEGVSGVVLDLRGNGGGSLQDVVDMVGLFIKNGPVVQVKSRGMEPQILADHDPRIQWDGPLIVLVNEMSASASEILAAAIQDYERGIIVGSKATFGKGTVQRFLNFDALPQQHLEEFKPLGAIKLTIQKFYRINGATTQLKGVESDVALPDNYSYIPIGEKEQANALPWDVIKPVKYTIWQNGYDRKALIAEAQKRIDADALFKKIDKGARYIKKHRDDTEVSLQLARYRKDRKEEDEELQKYEVLKSFNNGYVFTVPKHVASLPMDSTQTQVRQNWHKNLGQDIYLREAVRLLEKMK